MSVALAARPAVTTALDESDSKPARADLPARLLGVWAALVLTAFSTAVYGVFWAPKAALLLLVLGPGAVALVVAAQRRVPGARWALAFVASAGVSTLLADRRVLSLLGLHGWGTGWLFVVGLAGVWALGTGLGRDGARTVETGILVGALVTAVVGWLQILVALPIEALETGSRASGLLGNPVHLGAIAGGALCLVGGRMRSDSRRWGAWLPAAAVLVGAVQLSGSRAALVPAAIVVVVWVWRLGWRRGSALLGAVVLGLALAGAAATVGAGGGLATSRAETSMSPGSSTGRTAAWKAAGPAIRERPVFGWGPGRTLAGTSPHVGPEVARYEGGGAEYVDAHNLVLEYGVTTGLVGLALLALWVFSAGRRARGPLLGFAVTGAFVGLFQPQSVAVTPVLALALGAAMVTTDPPSPSSWRPWAKRIATAGVALGVAVTGVFLTGEVALARGVLDGSPGQAARADTLLAPWPKVSDVRWRVEAFDAVTTGDPGAWRRTLAAARDMVERDPSSSRSWAVLGDLELRRGHDAEARSAYRHASERYPWNARALAGLVYFAARSGDQGRVADLCAKRLVVAPRQDCPTAVLAAYGS